MLRLGGPGFEEFWIGLTEVEAVNASREPLVADGFLKGPGKEKRSIDVT